MCTCRRRALVNATILTWKPLPEPSRSAWESHVCPSRVRTLRMILRLNSREQQLGLTHKHCLLHLSVGLYINHAPIPSRVGSCKAGLQGKIKKLPGVSEVSAPIIPKGAIALRHRPLRAAQDHTISGCSRCMADFPNHGCLGLEDTQIRGILPAFFCFTSNLCIRRLLQDAGLSCNCRLHRARAAPRTCQGR